MKKITLILVLLNTYFSFGQCTLSLNLNVNNATDSSLCNGSVVANPSYGPVTYLWNCNNCSNVFSSSLDGLCSGSNGTVTVTDTMGCTVTANWAIGITACSNFGANVQLTNASGANTCDGSILVTPYGGTAPFYYSIDNGSSFFGSNNPTNLCPGPYSINVSDVNGCNFMSTTSIGLDSCAGLVINFSNVINTTTASSCDGSIIVNATGETAPYTYNWSNGITTSNADSLCNGLYSVCVTSSNGCQVCDSISITDTANVCDGFYVNYTINNATDSLSCDGSIIVYPAGGTYPYSFSYNNSAATNNDTYLNLCVGNYMITVVDANGCNSSIMQNVLVSGLCSTFSATTQMTNTSDSISCDGSMSVIVSGGMAPYSYIFFNSDTTSSSVANNLCVGTYTATIIDANGCTEVVTGNVNSEITIPADTIVLNDNIVIDSSFVGADSSDWINNCSIYYDSIISGYISGFSSLSNDSVIVDWVLSYLNGDSAIVTTNYSLNAGPGTYLLTLLLYCPQKSTPKYLVVNSAFIFQQSSLLESSFESLNLYPNPASDFIFIDGVNFNTNYEIIDLSGKILCRGKYDTKIDISNLSKGTYLVKVSNNNKNAILRFVK